VYGLANRTTSRYYTGKVTVVIDAPDWLTVVPDRCELEMTEGEFHNSASTEVTIEVRGDAPLGYQQIRIHGTRADGSELAQDAVTMRIADADR
jgi:hypothetical protein